MDILDHFRLNYHLKCHLKCLQALDVFQMPIFSDQLLGGKLHVRHTPASRIQKSFAARKAGTAATSFQRLVQRMHKPAIKGYIYILIYV